MSRKSTFPIFLAALALAACSRAPSEPTVLQPDLAVVAHAGSCRCDQPDYAILGCDGACSTTDENLCDRPGCLCRGRTK